MTAETVDETVNGKKSVAESYMKLAAHTVECLGTLRMAELRAAGGEVAVDKVASDAFLLAAYVLVDWERLVEEVEARGGDEYLSRLVDGRE